MKLADWIAESGLTQKAFAERVGVSQGRIAQIISGGYPRKGLAARIALATDGKVTANDFVADQPEKVAG